jgi:hypothetical protein
MAQFMLNINFTPEGLFSLSSAMMSVAMLQAAPDSAYQIVAILTQPQQSMRITWQDSAFVYTSANSIQEYSILHINNSWEVMGECLYAIDRSQISLIKEGLTRSVQITNQDASNNSAVTAGLATAFSVNNGKPSLSILTAESLLYNGTGTFQMSNSFYLTVLSSSAKAGMVIPPHVIPDCCTSNHMKIHPGEIGSLAAQPALLLGFSAASPVQNACFND